MEDKKLWRYYDIVKFFALIKGEMYFARADKFKDKYEGAMPKQCFNQLVEWLYIPPYDDKSEMELIKEEYLHKFNDRKKKAAISCWHINEKESAAMWDLYSNAGQGIAICTTMSKLNSIKVYNEYELKKFAVDYIDFDVEQNPDYLYYELLPFMKKRKEFEHEREYRMMIYQNNFNSKPFEGLELDFFNPIKPHEIVEKGLTSKLSDIPEGGVSIKINPADLIDEIVASPYMKEYEVKIIESLLDLFNKENRTSFKIRRSNLYDDVMY